MLEKTGRHRVFKRPLRLHSRVDPSGKELQLFLGRCIVMLRKVLQEFGHHAMMCPFVIHTVNKAILRRRILDLPPFFETGKEFDKLPERFLGPLHRHMPNDRVERPATMSVPRPDAAHYASRSASNALLDGTFTLRYNDGTKINHCEYPAAPNANIAPTVFASPSGKEVPSNFSRTYPTATYSAATTYPIGKLRRSITYATMISASRNSRADIANASTAKHATTYVAAAIFPAVLLGAI